MSNRNTTRSQSAGRTQYARPASYQKTSYSQGLSDGKPIPESLTYAIQNFSNGDEVIALQEMLNTVGFPTPVTGVYKDDTNSAAMAFEQSIGKIADGVIGNSTWQILRQMAAQKGKTTFGSASNATTSNQAAPQAPPQERQYFTQPTQPQAPTVLPSNPTDYSAAPIETVTPVAIPEEAPRTYFTQPSAVPQASTAIPEKTTTPEESSLPYQRCIVEEEGEDNKTQRIRRWQTRSNGLNSTSASERPSGSDRYNQDRYNQDRYNQDRYSEDRYSRNKFDEEPQAIPSYRVNEEQQAIPSYRVNEEPQAIPSYRVNEEPQTGLPMIRKQLNPIASEPVEEIAQTVKELDLRQRDAKGQTSDFITKLVALYDKHFGNTSVAKLFPASTLKAYLDYTRTAEFNREVQEKVKRESNHPLFRMKAQNACLEHYQGLLTLVQSGIDLTPEQLALFYVTGASQAAATYVPGVNQLVKPFCQDLTALVAEEKIPTAANSSFQSTPQQGMVQYSSTALGDLHSSNLNKEICTADAQLNRKKTRATAGIIGGITGAIGAIGAELLYIGKKDEKREKVSGWGVLGWGLVGAVLGGSIPSAVIGVTVAQDMQCEMPKKS